MRVDYNDLSVFLAVARERSFVAASRRLGLPTSTVSRRIGELEMRLGVQLLHRTTRVVSLTDDGRALADRCAGPLEDIDAATRQLLDRGTSDHLRGCLRVTAPALAGAETFGPWLLEFAAQHPELRLDLRLSNAVLDLVEEGMDLAFRLGPLRDGRYIARRLWSVPYVLCAHREFVIKHPEAVAIEHPRDLAHHRLILTPPVLSWSFVEDRTGDEVKFSPREPVMIINDLPLGAEAVRRGLGIGYLPCGLLAGELGGDLVAIMIPGWQSPGRDMHAVYPAGRQLSAKVRVAIDFVVSRRGERSGVDAALNLTSTESHGGRTPQTFNTGSLLASTLPGELEGTNASRSRAPSDN